MVKCVHQSPCYYRYIPHSQETRHRSHKVTNVSLISFSHLLLGLTAIPECNILANLYTNASFADPSLVLTDVIARLFIWLFCLFDCGFGGFFILYFWWWWENMLVLIVVTRKNPRIMRNYVMLSQRLSGRQCDSVYTLFKLEQFTSVHGRLTAKGISPLL